MTEDTNRNMRAAKDTESPGYSTPTYERESSQRWARVYGVSADGFHFAAALVRVILGFLTFQNPLQVERQTQRLSKEFKSLKPFYDQLAHASWEEKPELRDRLRTKLDWAEKNSVLLETLKAKLYKATFLNHSRLLVHFNHVFQDNTYLIEEIKFLVHLKDCKQNHKAEHVLTMIEENNRKIASLEGAAQSSDPFRYFFTSVLMRGKLQALKDSNLYLFRRFCYLTRQP